MDGLRHLLVDSFPLVETSLVDLRGLLQPKMQKLMQVESVTLDQPTLSYRKIVERYEEIIARSIPKLHNTGTTSPQYIRIYV